MKMKRLNFLCTILVASWILSTSSCNSKNRPVDVEGVVLLDNEPVADAMVLFIPEGATGQPAHGVTDEKGRFQLSTFKDNDGAFPGSYKVTVTKAEPVPELPAGEPGDSKSMVVHFRAIKQQKPGKSLLPAVYADQKSTPFHFTVPVSGKVTLELQKSGKN
jgi:hypothetical protein